MSGGRPGASVAASPDAAGSHAATRTTTPAVAPDGIATTALRWATGKKKAISRWRTGRGGLALAAVTVQLGDASQAAGVGLYDPTKQACEALSADVPAARAAPPIPDARMQRLYRKALARIGAAARHCRAAIRTWPEGDEDVQTRENKALLRVTRSGFAAGARQLYLATVRIRLLHR